MGFSAILTSELFGMRAALDHETLKKIDEKRELAFKEPKTDADRARLADLNEELGRLDFSKSARDPLYLEYVRAMTEAQRRNPEISDPTPTFETWRLRKKITDDLARKLVEDGVAQ